MEKVYISTFPNASATNPQGAAKGQTLCVNKFEDIHDLVQINSWSHLTFKDGRRQKGLFEKTFLLAADFDANLTIDEAIRRLKEHNLSYSITLSKSHNIIKNQGTPSEQAACNRFRLIVPLEKVILHGGTYLNTLLEFIKIFPEADNKCFDLARYFFPSTGEGETFFCNKGSKFKVLECDLSYDELLGQIKKKNRPGRPKKIGVSNFLAGAHTGLPGNFNDGLFATTFSYAINGKSQDQIIDCISKIAPEPLTPSDLRTIQSGVEAAAKAEPKEEIRSTERIYFEQTASFLKSIWKDRFVTLVDHFGSRMILEKQPMATVRSVDIQLLVSEATKIFSKTPFLRKPSRVKDAVENYLNLMEPLDKIPCSILTRDDFEYTFNRLDFEITEEPTPLFDEFLSRCTNAESFCAFIFSLFVPMSDLQQYVWLFGNGGDGKGAIARFLKKCLGTSYHADRAGGAGNNKHFTASFVGKRLAVFSDSNATHFVTSELFKELSGGDPIKIERKYQHPFTVSLDTKFLFLSNSLPKISSQKSDQRRIILCKVDPIKNEPDSYYEDNLWSERRGILWKCEQAYLKMTKNNGPIKCDDKDALDLALDFEVQFRTIFENCFVIDRRSRITPEKFYQSAKFSCETHNVKFDTFRQWAVRTHNLKQGRTKDSQNIRFIEGVRPTEEFGHISSSPVTRRQQYDEDDMYDEGYDA